MKVSKDELLKRITNISENASDYEDVGILLIQKCRKLYKKTDSIDHRDFKALIAIKFEIHELEFVLDQHKQNKGTAHAKLGSGWAYHTAIYGFLILILVYSYLFMFVVNLESISIAANNISDQSMFVYMKYLLLSIMGMMFYYVTTYIVKYSEIFTRLLVALFIPILITGVVFTLEDGALKFSGGQSIVFLLGYNTNLIIALLKKANDKLKASIESQGGANP
ncbi:hypothetical protein [Paenibacillus sp. FSL R5-0519]|uniref:hypothetical protein n=1 Tax=Paenibacillus sp. FSL R5-0519 TaxID=2921648 RepID=UPI0030D95C0E